MSDEEHQHRCFAAWYTRMSRSRGFRNTTDASRQFLAEMARGNVIEIGAGGGQNFEFYDPSITERVEAVEPNQSMLRHATQSANTSRVPIHLTQATAEQLPFPDATFDTALMTLVMCSVTNPMQSLDEIKRVLKPGGHLLLLEHVRSRNQNWARLQNWFTPIQRRVAGNCHLNRDTAASVRNANFAVQSEDWVSGGLHPMITLVAAKTS